MAKDPDGRSTRRLDTQLLSDFHVFDAVVQAGGMGAAARSIGISQGAVSQRIARLEARIGFALFVRGHDGLSLTPKGEPLAAAAREAIGILAQAVTDLHPESGLTVRVNCTPSLARDWLVPALQAFHAAHPDVELVVYADQAPVTAARLADEGIDIAIRYAPQPLPGCVELAAVAEETVPVCAPGYLAGHPGGIVRLHDETPWNDAAHDAEWREWEDAGGRIAIPVERDQRFNLATLAYDAASAGQGVAMGRLLLVRHRLASGELTVASQAVAMSASYRFTAVSRPARRGATMRFVDWAVVDLRSAHAQARRAIAEGGEAVA